MQYRELKDWMNYYLPIIENLKNGNKNQRLVRKYHLSFYVKSCENTIQSLNCRIRQ